MIEAGRYTVIPEDVHTHIPVKIGSFTSIASGLTIVSGQHPPIQNRAAVSNFPFYEWGWGDYTPCSDGTFGILIGSDVWIGEGVTILEDVYIRSGAIIGAGSVVTKTVASYQVVAGNPAKHINWRFGPNVVSDLLELEWWNWPDDKIKEAIPYMKNINDFLDKYG